MSANGISRLPTREERQKAKLELAAAKRSKNNNARSIYNIDDLPTQYVANSVVDNSTNLSIGRPWVSGNYVKNIITNIFSPSDLMCVVDLNDLTADKLSWRRNLFTYTTDITNTVWLKTGTPTGAPTFIGNVLAPDGTNTAVSYSFSSGNHIRQVLNVTGGIPGTASIWVRKGTTNPAKAIRIVSNNTLAWNTGGSTKILLSNEWTRVSATQIVTGTNNQRYIMFGTNLIDGSNDPECNGSIELWRPQYELGSTATDYQPITNFNTEFLNRFPLHTLYQDAAGTIPATAAGQPVGLALDKSKGLVVGAERITNGGFDTDLSGWQSFNAKGTLSWSNGVARNTATAQYDSGLITTSNTVLQEKRFYKVSFKARCSANGRYLDTNLDNAVRVQLTTVWNTYSLVGYISANNNFVIRFGQGTELIGDWFEIDDISVKELAGNHAYQTTSASRPVLGRHPVGGARNLLTYSGDFANSAWNKYATTVNSTAETPPLTGMPVVKLLDTTANSPHFVNNTTLSLLPNVRGTFSIFAKAAEITKLRVEVQDFGKPDVIRGDFDLVAGTVINQENLGLGTQATATIVPMGNGWYRCAISGIPSTSTSGRYVPSFHLMEDFVTNTFTGTGTQGLYIAGAQLEVGSVATNYQETTTLLDITERGKADAWYLKFDGVDDSLQTNSIDFTGTDKISLFAGVRKLSDVRTGIIFEFSQSSAANNGSFHLAAPESANGNNYQVASRGTVRSIATTPSTYIPPVSNIVSAFCWISSDTAKIRINGTQVVTIATDQGTGSYGNYPLYIGRRAGTTYPFNGHLYSLVIVGRLSTNSETNAMENAISKQMGVLL